MTDDNNEMSFTVWCELYGEIAVNTGAGRIELDSAVFRLALGQDPLTRDRLTFEGASIQPSNAIQSRAAESRKTEDVLTELQTLAQAKTGKDVPIPQSVRDTIDAGLKKEAKALEEAKEAREAEGKQTREEKASGAAPKQTKPRSFSAAATRRSVQIGSKRGRVDAAVNVDRPEYDNNPIAQLYREIHNFCKGADMSFAQFCGCLVDHRGSSPLDNNSKAAGVATRLRSAVSEGRTRMKLHGRISGALGSEQGAQSSIEKMRAAGYSISDKLAEQLKFTVVGLVDQVHDPEVKRGRG